MDRIRLIKTIQMMGEEMIPGNVFEQSLAPQSGVLHGPVLTGQQFPIPRLAKAAVWVKGKYDIPYPLFEGEFEIVN